MHGCKKLPRKVKKQPTEGCDEFVCVFFEVV